MTKKNSNLYFIVDFGIFLKSQRFYFEDFFTSLSLSFIDIGQNQSLDFLTKRINL